MSPEQLMALATARGVNLEAVSRGGEPEWTPEDVALAAAGLGKVEFAAAMYSLAGDMAYWRRLHTYLLEHLLAQREAHQWTQWAESVGGGRFKFAHDLVRLVLAEELAPGPAQESPGVRANLIGVEPGEWRRAISHQWACVAGELRRLVIDAEYHVRQKIREGA